MANNEEHKKISMILSFLSIDLSCSDAGPELLHRSAPDFGIVSVNSSFLPQDIPRHPDAHLFEVREAFKRTLLPSFGAYMSAYIAKKKSTPAALPGDPPGPLRGATCCRRVATRVASQVAVPETDAGPLINALSRTVKSSG